MSEIEGEAIYIILIFNFHQIYVFSGYYFFLMNHYNYKGTIFQIIHYQIHFSQ